MDIFSEFKTIITDICTNKLLVADSSLLSNVTAETPRDPEHGDIATNAAMVLAKTLGKNPREIASVIVKALEENQNVSSVSIAGPGFINIRLSNESLYSTLKSILEHKESYGNLTIGESKHVNVEYVSVNPTGPMHIGHARNAIIGDAVARVLKKAGYKVTKEFYVNDAGAQVEVLAKSAFLRYKEILGDNIGEIPPGLYPGEYMIDVAKKFAEKYGDKFKENNEYPQEIKFFAIAQIMELIKADLNQIGVQHDVFTSEQSIYDKNYIQESIKMLENYDLLYRGVLEPPKGKKPDDWEPREQLLFKSTEFGDDVDRPLQKSDGTYTYFTGDIAYHYDKIKRKFDDLVIVLGADHGGYVKRLKAVVSALSQKNLDIKCLIAQLVKLMEGGQPVKMSKRAGNFILLQDVVDKVGKDVLRFMMLTRKSDASLDFDLKKVLETTKDNPVFYVQYASARISSVLRQSLENNISEKEVASADLSFLSHEAELKLIKKMSEFPKVIEASANFMEPHRITYYLNELASEFHYLWSLGKTENLKLIDDSNDDLTKARLALISACKYVIKSGLDVLGVEAMEKM